MRGKSHLLEGRMPALRCLGGLPWGRLVLALAAVSLVGGLAAADEDVSVRWEAESEGGSGVTVRVEPQDGELEVVIEAERLSVYRVVDDRRSSMAMAGKVIANERGLRWSPRFPLREGAIYEAVYRCGGETDDREVVARFETSRVTREAPQLLRVSPSSEVVPENLLRVYLEFDQPMARGYANRQVSLIDDQGREVELPFLQLDEELWNAAGTRVTLLLDPGRVKRGLKPNEEEGRALEMGRRYRLRVSAEWPSATGVALGEVREQEWEVVAPDEASPDWNAWQFEVPPLGTRETLVVRFEAPLDRGLAERLIVVREVNEAGDAAGEPKAGKVGLSDGECEWRFEPSEPWGASVVRLEVAPELEDWAGNGFQRRFETDANAGEVMRRLPVLKRDLLLPLAW